MHTFIVRNITFPLSQIISGRKRWRQELRSLCEQQWLTPEVLKQFQLEQLRSLLQYVSQTIPYYRDIMLQKRIDPHAVTDIDQLQEFPLMNKEIINNNLEKLYNPNFPRKIYKNSSSGSTGHPVSFYDDGIKAGLGVAEEARIKLNFGLKLGLSEARFVRLTEDTISHGITFRNRKRFINQLILPGMNLSEEVFERSKEKILKFKPRIIFGISSALYEFTRFLRDQGYRKAPWNADLIICWAAPVFQHYTELFSNFYQCPVVNLYSAREVGHLAASCPEGKLHLFEENRIFEIVRHGKRVSSGESGEIVVTTLKPYAMPMIRYNTEDIGKVSNDQCPCGRGLTILQEFEGRAGEMLYLSNGKIISPNYCCRLFMSQDFIGVIKRFQVIQKDELNLEIKIVKNSRFSDTLANNLIRILKNSIGEDVSINLSFVEQIEPQPSGKFLITRREIPATAETTTYRRAGAS